MSFYSRYIFIQMNEVKCWNTKFKTAQIIFHTALCMKSPLPENFFESHQDEITTVLSEVNMRIQESVWKKRSVKLVGRPPLHLPCAQRRRSSARPCPLRDLQSSSFRHPCGRLYYIKKLWH